MIRRKPTENRTTAANMTQPERRSGATALDTRSTLLSLPPKGGCLHRIHTTNRRIDVSTVTRAASRSRHGGLMTLAQGKGSGSIPRSSAYIPRSHLTTRDFGREVHEKGPGNRRFHRRSSSHRVRYRGHRARPQRALHREQQPEAGDDHRYARHDSGRDQAGGRRAVLGERLWL